MNTQKHCRYIAIFAHYSEGISITFPDFQGCVSFGTDEEDAIKHAKEVLSLHISGMVREGEEIPKPSSLCDVELYESDKAVLIEVSAPLTDPFYSDSNMNALRDSIEQLNSGETVIKTIEELKSMEE